MFTIIPQSEFKTVPWKNGKGETIELAISTGGSLDNFDWRLSIARVVDDGPFSDFSGYYRNLVLLSGKGIKLEHSDAPTNNLVTPLSVARFDGGNQTHGYLRQGPITDFNVMVNSSKFEAKVETYIENSTLNITTSNLVFCYAATNILQINDHLSETTVQQGSLVEIEPTQEVQPNRMTIRGRGFILIELMPLSMS